MSLSRPSLLLLLFLFLTACAEPGGVDCDGGRYHADDTGRYCAYGVIVGGFSCPDELPYPFDVPLPDGQVGVMCSDRPDGGALPLPVCTDLGASEGCEATPRSAATDGGTGRIPLPERTPDCAAGFEPGEPGSIGGIRVGRPGTDARMPLDELSDGDSVTVYQDETGNPALALGLQIGPETGEIGYACYKIRIRNTFASGAVVDSPPVDPLDTSDQYLAEWAGRLPVVYDQLGALAGSLDGENVTLEISVQSGAVVETRSIMLSLVDPE